MYAPTCLRKYMPRKVLEGCQWGSAVPRTVLAPLTGPQVNVQGIYFRMSGIHFRRRLNSQKAPYFRKRSGARCDGNMIYNRENPRRVFSSPNG